MYAGACERIRAREALLKRHVEAAVEDALVALCGKKAKHPRLYKTITVRTVTHTYASRNDDTRRLVREDRKVERIRLADEAKHDQTRQRRFERAFLSRDLPDSKAPSTNPNQGTGP